MTCRYTAAIRQTLTRSHAWSCEPSPTPITASHEPLETPCRKALVLNTTRSEDQAAVAGIGLERIALALAGLFEGMTPEEFAAAAREFMGSAAHPTLGRP